MKTKKKADCAGNPEPYSYHCDCDFYGGCGCGRSYGWKCQLKCTEE